MEIGRRALIIYKIYILSLICHDRYGINHLTNYYVDIVVWISYECSMTVKWKTRDPT